MNKDLYKLNSSEMGTLKGRFQRSKDKATESLFMPLKHDIPLLEAVLKVSDCGAAILEASSTNYIYISKSFQQMLGYKSGTYEEQGLDFILSITHPDDREGLRLILHQELDFLWSLTNDQCAQYFCSYDYRLQTADGQYIRVLQRNNILQSDDQGLMQYMLCIITDISHLKGDQNMIMHIKIGADIKSTYFYSLSDPKLIEAHFPSQRELQILKLLRKEYSSKRISDILFISVHTVETHRRNMLKKANVKDTSNLVCFALTAGLI